MSMWVLMHTKGSAPCGKPAVKACRKPVRTDPVTPEVLRNIDGTIPLSTDLLVCQSCGGQIFPIGADDFIEDQS